MNEDQFLLMQDAVQWAADEHDRGTGDRKWNQNTWGTGRIGQTPVKGVAGHYPLKMDCGSSCCLAGTAVLMAGAKIVVYLGVDGTKSHEPGEVMSASECVPAGATQSVPIPEYARQVMGLDGYASRYLFEGSRSIDQMIAYATEIAQHHGYTMTITRKAA